LESNIRRLKIHSLKDQIETARELSNMLAGQFESTPSSAERTQIAKRYDEALKQTHAMQFLLELLEREATKEARA
jgi:hypothetical protein